MLRKLPVGIRIITRTSPDVFRNLSVFDCSFPYLHIFFDVQTNPQTETLRRRLSLQCYKRILQLDPVNVQGLHNLCVVYVERGKLAKAHDCMLHVRQLAPHEDYILRHLQIVQTRIAKLKRSAGHTLEKEIAFEAFDPEDFGGTTAAAAASGGIQATVDYADADDGGDSMTSPIVRTDADASAAGSGTQKSVSKHPKPVQRGATAAEAAAAGGADAPVFLESEAATIQQEYRTSNSVQNNIGGVANGRRYQPLHRNVLHPQRGGGGGVAAAASAQAVRASRVPDVADATAAGMS